MALGCVRHCCLSQAGNSKEPLEKSCCGVGSPEDGTGCNRGFHGAARGAAGGPALPTSHLSGFWGTAWVGTESCQAIQPLSAPGRVKHCWILRKPLGWWVPTTTFGKQGETVAENPILINYFRSWDTAVLLFGIYLFWLRVGLEKSFLSIIPKTISAELGCFPQGRFTVHICTGVVFLTLESTAPSACPRGERSARLSVPAIRKDFWLVKAH